MTNQRLNLGLRKMAPGTFGGQSRIATAASIRRRLGAAVTPSPVTPPPEPPACTTLCPTRYIDASAMPSYSDGWDIDHDYGITIAPDGTSLYAVASLGATVAILSFPMPALSSYSVVRTLPDYDFALGVVDDHFWWTEYDASISTLWRAPIVGGSATLVHSDAARDQWGIIEAAGRVWLAADNGSGDGGIVEFTISGTYVGFHAYPGSYFGYYYSLVRAADDALWMPVDDYGLARFDTTSHTWTSDLTVDVVVAPATGGAVRAVETPASNTVVLLGADMAMTPDPCIVLETNMPVAWGSSFATADYSTFGWADRSDRIVLVECVEAA